MTLNTCKRSNYAKPLARTQIASSGRSAQSQRYPRIVFLLVLIGSLVLFLVVANISASVTRTTNIIISNDNVNSNNDYDYNLQQGLPNENYRSQQPPPVHHDPYDRKIFVTEYQQEDDDDDNDDGNEDDNNNIGAAAAATGVVDSDGYYCKWSEGQIEEMKRHYKRYLEVFFETHGDGYEPEDMEVVYGEYLAFRERKARERDDERMKRTTGTTATARNTESKQTTTTTKVNDVREDRSSNSNTGTSRPMETHNGVVRTSSSYPDNTIIKHDPYYLGMDWEDFNEVGGDHFGPASNYTETMMTTDTAAPGSSSIVVVAVGGRESFANDDSIKPPISGQGRVFKI